MDHSLVTTVVFDVILTSQTVGRIVHPLGSLGCFLVRATELRGVEFASNFGKA